MDANPASTDFFEAMEEDDLEQEPKKCQKCEKCHNHDVISTSRDHYLSCRFRKCSCEKCTEVTNKNARLTFKRKMEAKWQQDDDVGSTSTNTFSDTTSQNFQEEIPCSTNLSSTTIHALNSSTSAPTTNPANIMGIEELIANKNTFFVSPQSAFTKVGKNNIDTAPQTSSLSESTCFSNLSSTTTHTSSSSTSAPTKNPANMIGIEEHIANKNTFSVSPQSAFTKVLKNNNVSAPQTSSLNKSTCSSNLSSTTTNDTPTNSQPRAARTLTHVELMRINWLRSFFSLDLHAQWFYNK